jgi:hypothetical protein
MLTVIQQTGVVRCRRCRRLEILTREQAVRPSWGYGNDPIRNGPYDHERTARQRLPASGFGRSQ